MCLSDRVRVVVGWPRKVCASRLHCWWRRLLRTLDERCPERVAAGRARHFFGRTASRGRAWSKCAVN